MKKMEELKTPMLLRSGPMEIREPTTREFSLNSSIFTNSSLTLNVLLNDYECHDEYVDMMFKEAQLSNLKCSIFMDKDEGSSPLEKIARMQEWFIMPLGLTNVPSISMKLMNHAKREFIDEFWIVGLDNIDRKSTRLNSSHITRSRMPSSA